MAKFAVIGLGRFGYTVATELFTNGIEVVAIDYDEKKIEEIKDKVTTPLIIDSTDENALRNSGISDMDGIVLAIGSNVEASILTAAILKKIGISNIYAKVDSKIHSRILKMIGIQNIYFPEVQVGKQLSKFLLSSNVLKYTELSGDMSIAELLAPEEFVGKTLQELALPIDHGVNIVAIKTEELSVGEDGENIINNEINSMPGANDIVKSGDVLILTGEPVNLDKLILPPK
ncbi:MAG: TrkA family potassium uptake protein [Candidatus Cloacimonadota bacterium]|nr:TrkA family potassium uptake protein [Candidatus Cloacimonadota bacterium]